MIVRKLGIAIVLFLGLAWFLGLGLLQNSLAQEDQEYYPQLCAYSDEFPIQAGSMLLENPYYLFIDIQIPSGASFRVYDFTLEETVSDTVTLDQVHLAEYAGYHFVCLTLFQWDEVLDLLELENYRSEIGTSVTFETPDELDLTATAAVQGNNMSITLEENALVVFFESDTDYVVRIIFPDGSLNTLEFNANPVSPGDMFVFTGNKVGQGILCSNEEQNIYAFVLVESGNPGSFCADMVDGNGVQPEGYNRRVYVFPPQS